METKQKLQSWTNEKSRLNDWFHYTIEIKTLKDDYENFNLREFEVKIKKQTKDLCMNSFKTIKVITSFSGLLQELIQKLKMYSCYIKINDSPLYDLNVYNFYNDTLKWRKHIENLFTKHDMKENKYRLELEL